MSGIFGDGFHLMQQTQTAMLYVSNPPDSLTSRVGYTAIERVLQYRFHLHEHPYASTLMERYLRGTVWSLLAADTERVTEPDGEYRYEQQFFESDYSPDPMVVEPYPALNLDFSADGAYSVYNWELFFHVPITLAVQLSRAGKYEEAQRWFHTIFDPTDTSKEPSPQKYWKVKPFQAGEVQMTEDLLVNLASGQDPEVQRTTQNAIRAWRNDPFRPHLVARYRPTAYMLMTVMSYLDNLIAWGDSLFREDTRESINEASQLYVLAALLLGPRPRKVSKLQDVAPQTYAKLRANLDDFGNALVSPIAQTEGGVPGDLMMPATTTADEDRFRVVRSIGQDLYFSVPRNEKLLGYWDTVADRLFKIRNSLNLQGAFRQLPLFDPPIDPGLLAKASAAGVDVGAIIAGSQQAVPLVRFSLMLQRAQEICQEVKSLGQQLLSVMEKEDSEALQVLRAKHEKIVLSMAESVRYQQWQEAKKSRESAELALNSAKERWSYYQRLLGGVGDRSSLEAISDLDRGALEDMSFTSTEPAVATSPIAISSKPVLDGKAARPLSPGESKELDLLAAAQPLQLEASLLDSIGAVMNMIPSFSIDVKPIGMGPGMSLGGSNIAAMLSAFSMVSKAKASMLSYEATLAAKLASYERRQQEWTLQSNLAAHEITQLNKQLRGAQIRESIVERELKNHQQQIRNAEDIEVFLTDEKSGKKTNQGFYAWLRREVRGLYSQAFQFAYDVAKKAEKALQHELGDPQLSYIQYGYLSGREGLLAGEKLWLDIKRMEVGYLELNKREHELTRHVSLLQLDPTQLVSLRTTGKCSIKLPEELFDLDCPGHFFRRLKSVAISIPCVTGPYASVNCKLTLGASQIRVSDVATGAYPRSPAPADDARFRDEPSSVESIVTSSSSNDAGLFEVNLRDERLLPFEGAGAISDWTLELPGDVRQFDYDTIADVVMHVRYTARDGGTQLATSAKNHLSAMVDGGTAYASTRLFSLRHEFPMAWAAFKQASVGPSQTAELKIQLQAEHYPMWAPQSGLVTKSADLLTKSVTGPLSVLVGTQTDATDFENGLPVAGLAKASITPLPAAVGLLSLKFNRNDLSDVWLALTWGKAGS